MEALFLKIRLGIKFIELLAALSGFICWRRLYPAYWKAFPVYLLVISMCEFTGWYLNSHHHYQISRIMYGYFVVPAEFLFMQYLFYHILGIEFRKVVSILAFIFIAVSIAEPFWINKIAWKWLSLSYITGSVSLLILSVIYFLQLLGDESVLKFRQLPSFWVNLGLILFYVGTFPYYATINFLYEKDINLFWILSWLMIVLNYTMYSFFIVAFLCFRKPR